MDGLTAGRIGQQLADERAQGKPCLSREEEAALRLEVMTDAYGTILKTVFGELSNGTRDTPARAAKALVEMTSGYSIDIPSLFTKFEGEGYDEMIAVKRTPFSSLCEHHMLPFTGYASIVYLPTDAIIGLSKLPRLVQAFSRRFQNQERIGMQIADALEEHLKPRGVLVRLEAHHTCMSLRGIRAAGEMVTSVTRGMMRDDPKARDEALRLIGA